MWPGNFQRIPCEKESEEASMLIWTNFNSFAIIVIVINHLFHFSTSILHGSSSKIKTYGS